MPDELPTPKSTVKPDKQGIGKWLVVALVVVILDQASKWAVLHNFAETERLPVIPGFFDLTLYFNEGAAFSFLADAAGWQRWFFTIFGGLAACFIIYLLRQSTQLKLFSFGLAMILGGAVGNQLLDRPIHGKVVDFLLFYQHPYYFPAFNLADSAIFVGAVCLILDELLRWKRERRQTAASES
jgi:signal peptidase II